MKQLFMDYCVLVSFLTVLSVFIWAWCWGSRDKEASQAKVLGSLVDIDVEIGKVVNDLSYAQGRLRDSTSSVGRLSLIREVGCLSDRLDVLRSEQGRLQNELDKY